MNRPAPRRRLARALVVALALVPTVACTAPGGAASLLANPSITAEADVFSGRENPTWQLDATAQAALDACLAKASSASATTPPAMGLGFRGLIVHGLSVDGINGRTLVAIPGMTTLSAGGEHVALNCPSLYAALRTSARDHLVGADFALLPDA